VHLKRAGEHPRSEFAQLRRQPPVPLVLTIRWAFLNCSGTQRILPTLLLTQISDHTFEQRPAAQIENSPRSKSRAHLNIDDEHLFALIVEVMAHAAAVVNAHLSRLHPHARGYVVASTNTGHPGELFIPQGADGIDPGRAERRNISRQCRHERWFRWPRRWTASWRGDIHPFFLS